jgi:hypothetical protein
MIWALSEMKEFKKSKSCFLCSTEISQSIYVEHICESVKELIERAHYGRAR